MLCQFSVKNYKSIRDEVTLDMQAAAIPEHTDRVITAADGQSFLPVSVIYGPNGGGKSNVLEALQTLGAAVRGPICTAGPNGCADHPRSALPIKPFAFSGEGKNRPTEFEIFFRTKAAEYRYMLHIKTDAVVYERLDRVKPGTGGSPSALFVREGGAVSLKGDFTRLKIGGDLQDSVPFLSYLGSTHGGSEVVADAVGWFQTGIAFRDGRDPRAALCAAAASEEIRRLVLGMLREADLGIEDFRAETTADGRVEIYTRHMANGHGAELPLPEESGGIQKLFALLPFIAESLAAGTALVTDDLDAKLHPVLLRYIIMLFNRRQSNRHGAQLIFTAHDLSVMNSDVFRRDQIWFAAKGRSQDSRLYSLVEFKPEHSDAARTDAGYGRQYLEGRYGADPYLKKIINWSVGHAGK